MSNKKIYVELTLGHKAQIRPKPTVEGFTHDWEVFVRSDQGIIEAFVDRVIFHLHESFPKPRRVVKEPPFSVKESGYAGFMVTIEIVFKSKEEPRRAEFKYDLFLQSQGIPISHSRREKLIFNFPSDEFAKKLFKGGGVLRKEKDSSGGDSSANSSSLITSHSGGKSSKHSSPNLGKGSPKSSFETLFGPPIKRGVSSLTTATVAASTNPYGPSKDSRAGTSGKGGKGESSYGQVNGGKGEKVPSKSPAEKHGDKASNSPMPMLDSPSGSEGSSNPSSSKSSKSSHNSPSVSEKRSRSEEKTRRMLPPEHAAVPRKSKKSEIFTPSPSSTSTSSTPKEKSRKKAEKSKKRSSKHSKVKREDDSYPSTVEVPTRREVKKEPEVEMKKERVSPISSSSDASSASSVSSGSEVNSEEESEVESEQEEMIEKSNKRIAAANSTSSSKRRSKQRSESESGSDESPPPPLQRSPASSPASSSCSSGVPSPSPPKRRKTSNSSSDRTPDYHTRSQSPMEKPISSSSVKVKKESRHHRKRSEEEKRNRKSRKKSKKHKKKVFEEDPHSSDSSISSVASYASPITGNGVSSNGLSPMPTFPSGATTTGSLTPEMGLLQELHNRIASIGDPEKLQEVVDIVVDSGGRDLWTMESGFSFDFDLCRLSPLTIRKIQEAIIH